MIFNITSHSFNFWKVYLLSNSNNKKVIQIYIDHKKKIFFFCIILCFYKHECVAKRKNWKPLNYSSRIYAYKNIIVKVCLKYIHIESQYLI